MSKRQHQRQLQRTRDKRRSDRFERRRRRARWVAIAAAAALLLSVFAAVLAGAFEGGTDPVDPDAEDPDPVASACPPAEDVPEVEAEEYAEPPDMQIDEDATYLATLDTTCGEIVLELDAAGAPTATNNFVFLAEEGFYDGVLFHRVIEEFMIQGGDPQGTGGGGPGYTFDDELGPAKEHYEQVREELLATLGDLDDDEELDADDLDPAAVPSGYARGRVAMANSGPDTNGSQFFITHGDPALLPEPAYTLFGEVVVGMEVVDTIASDPTDGGDQPLEPVHIRGITIDET